METNSLRFMGKGASGKLCKGIPHPPATKHEPTPNPELNSKKEPNETFQDSLRQYSPAQTKTSEDKNHDKKSLQIHIKSFSTITNKYSQLHPIPYKRFPIVPENYDPSGITIKSVLSEKDYEKNNLFPSLSSTKALKAQPFLVSKKPRPSIEKSLSPSPWTYSPNLPSSQSAIIFHKPPGVKKNIRSPFEFFANGDDDDSTPGPGEYDILKPSMHERPSAVFAKSALDRFGKPVDRFSEILVPSTFLKGRVRKKAEKITEAIPKNMKSMKNTKNTNKNYYRPGLKRELEPNKDKNNLDRAKNNDQLYC